MKYKVTDKCITCNTCVALCPTGAIGKGLVYYEIDQETCVGCGMCFKKCPAMAVVEQD